MSYHPLSFLPIWAFFLAACVLIVVPLEAGFRLGRRQHRAETEEKDPSTGVFVGAILALLAFMLAFTFGMAGSRFEERRQAVLEEANAIGTTYLRSDLLPEPQRSEVAELLRDYVNFRLHAQQQNLDPELMLQAVAESEEITGRIWGIAVSVAEAKPIITTSLFIQALNETIDVNSKRVAYGTQAWLPATLWLGLFAVSLVSLASAGYLSGSHSNRRSLVMFGLVPAFAIVLTLIADLDNPREGFLRTNLAPLIDLQETMTPPS